MTILKSLKKQMVDDNKIPKGESIFTVYYGGYECSFSIKNVTEELFERKLNNAIKALKKKFDKFDSYPVIIAMMYGSKMYSLETLKIE